MEKRVEEIIDRSVGYYDGELEASRAKAEASTRILLKLVRALSKNKDLISEKNWEAIASSQVFWED